MVSIPDRHTGFPHAGQLNTGAVSGLNNGLICLKKETNRILA